MKNKKKKFSILDNTKILFLSFHEQNSLNVSYTVNNLREKKVFKWNYCIKKFKSRWTTENDTRSRRSVNGWKVIK